MIELVKGWNGHPKGTRTAMFTPGIMGTLVARGFAIWCSEPEPQNNTKRSTEESAGRSKQLPNRQSNRSR